MALTVIASLTDTGRQRLAQSLITGKSFIVNQFSLNSSGHDPANPTLALTPDTSSVTCPGGTPLYSSPILSSVLITAFCPQFECLVPQAAAVGAISNICLSAQIVYSPILNDPDLGSTFLFAIGNFPLKVKTSSDSLSIIVTVQF